MRISRLSNPGMSCVSKHCPCGSTTFKDMWHGREIPSHHFEFIVPRHPANHGCNTLKPLFLVVLPRESNHSLGLLPFGGARRSGFRRIPAAQSTSSGSPFTGVRLQLLLPTRMPPEVWASETVCLCVLSQSYISYIFLCVYIYIYMYMHIYNTLRLSSFNTILENKEDLCFWLGDSQAPSSKFGSRFPNDDKKLKHAKLAFPRGDGLVHMLRHTRVQRLPKGPGRP